MFANREFAGWLQKKQSAAQGPITFIIGGAYGVSDPVKARCSESLALSKWTLPHQLIRILFVEQLYRAYSLNAGHGYHHE